MEKEKKILEYEEAPSGYIMLYNYKEPFIKFNGGYGFYGVLAHDPKKDLIQCHLCGDWFERLSNHLMREHAMSCDEYKAHAGLEKKTALINEKLRNKLIAHGQNNIKTAKNNFKNNTYERTKEMREKIRATLKRNVMETRNKHATCPAQLIERLKKQAKKLGRTPTSDEVTNRSTLAAVFGSYSDAVKAAGLPYDGGDPWARRERTWPKEKCIEMVRDLIIKFGKMPTCAELFKMDLKNFYAALNRHGKGKILTQAVLGNEEFIYTQGNFINYTDEILLRFMRKFKELHEREPSPSDTRRKLLPNVQTYYNHFGSWKNAKELAFNQPIPSALNDNAI